MHFIFFIAFAFIGVAVGAETTTTKAVTVTSCPPTVSACPGKGPLNSTEPVFRPVGPTGLSPSPTAKLPDPKGNPNAKPTDGVILSTMIISTCIPTVITSVVTITPPKVTEKPIISAKPSSPGFITKPPQPQFTGAANALKGPTVLAGLAGLLVFAL
ncbi:BgTH12-03739 [Blumeria graminis f. sp. triticale]|uniref:BgtAcSP-30729 n=3 Tax=Blumeria graminis TaxID=34373 RepID=A0A9X9L8L1_BLUGR|nr:hypothetical protein BGT96224_AcSP30729 [Blumeria graminis f. sp. tritici 96224]CAD6499629.1 BgTH12-03739 [Blumeria graminis f. sp. triticale]VCU39756.1 BgtAcSP-30729 [Blumeria graminis f. sp. tritici]